MNNQQPQYLFPEGSQFGRDNLVLHATAKRHIAEEVKGPLSIKTVFRGRVNWMINGRPLCVDRNTLLVLNDGETYSLNIDEMEPVETRCVFFRRDFVQQVAFNITNSLEAALDDPAKTNHSLHFSARLHSDVDKFLSDVWMLVKNYSTKCQPSGFQEDLLMISLSLLRLHQETVRQLSNVPAAKASTRKELFRRLQIAKEYLHSCIEEPVSLEDVAGKACLSPYHFHRAFRQTFQTTPHRYVTDLKLKRARTLLVDKKMSVSETAEKVGFASVPSFSRLFSGYFGTSPSTFLKP